MDTDPLAVDIFCGAKSSFQAQQRVEVEKASRQTLELLRQRTDRPACKQALDNNTLVAASLLQVHGCSQVVKIVNEGSEKYKFALGLVRSY